MLFLGFKNIIEVLNMKVFSIQEQLMKAEIDNSPERDFRLVKYTPIECWSYGKFIVSCPNEATIKNETSYSCPPFNLFPSVNKLLFGHKRLIKNMEGSH